MSEKRRKSYTTTLGMILCDVLARSAYTAYSDRAALYVVELTNNEGFALAEQVRAKVAGPDPAILRERAQKEGVRRPRMVGSAPLELLATLVESLAATPDEGEFRGWFIREIFARGAVPVLLVEEGGVVVCTLAEVVAGESSGAPDIPSGWTLPIVGQA